MRTRIESLAAAVVLAAAMQAQTSRGTVSGTVLDPSGAVVTGAAVVLTNTQTGVRRSATSNDAGIYRFDAVDLGVYELRVTHAGFKAFLATGLGVQANLTTTIDPRLELGSETIAVQVSAEAEALMVRDGPQRGGNFVPRQVSQLPLIGRNPFSLARTLPGVIQPSGGFQPSRDPSMSGTFAVNGQRVRGNNYLIDGTENNDISLVGSAQPFNMADAVEEVSVQTGNFSVEFGRASGGVFNVVTKAGTNQVHGTAYWRYRSQRFDSVSNLARLNQIPKSVFSHNVPGFTVGGPIRRDRTFFFGSFQQDTRRSTQNFSLVVPTAVAVERLRSLFQSNPRLDLYLDPLGNLRGVGAPFSLALGVDPQTGVNRGSVEFATAALGLPATDEGPQYLVRVDHHRSGRHRFSWRYIRDSRIDTPSAVSLGFVTDSAERNHNFLFTDSYTFGPSFTNEFRFSYGRLHVDQLRVSPRSVPQARTQPSITITSISALGVANEQFRLANNLLFQETQTKLSGRHIFRYGAELLQQIATQLPNATIRGQIPYTNAPLEGYSAFANFLDDYSGPSARMQRHIGAAVFHPNQFRQTYFLQDTWKATPALTLTLGLRYENFGQFANAVRYPAFAGFEPERFLEPNKVNRDDNNFGPAFGLAWSPSFRSGWLGRLLGDRRTVWRGGYQISYEALKTQMLSLNLAITTPNALFVGKTGAPTGRGDPNWSAQLPAATPRPPTIADDQEGAIEKDLRSPYTERWSFGFQRQLPGYVVLDVSYVGAAAHKLTTNADFNPGTDGNRLHPAFGIRRVRTSQGNSAYHSLQARLDRRFAKGFQLAASYTWSKSLDSTSEGINQTNTQYTNINLTSVPVAQGGLKLDRGVSDFHRGQRLTFLYLWEVPGPSKGLWKHALGGWSIAGITSFQTGTPNTVQNGSDRNRDGHAGLDRADISNPQAPRHTRAILAPATGPQRCSTGYRNPDTATCVSASDVYWVEGIGPPNASTVGRNTLFTGGTNNFDLTLFKSFAVAERKRLEFRWEAVNAFNHPQYTDPPATRSVRNALAGRFLNRDFTDSGIRSMWVQVKVIF